MSGWLYVWRNMRHRSFLSALTIFAVMITVALFTLLLMSKDGVEQGAQKGYGPFELVIGADGSESQLILNTFYRVGVPTGNIPIQVLDSIKQNKHAESVLGMTTGDSHNGYPIVGIDPAYFQIRYEDRSLAEGKLYSELGGVTLGYTVARALGLHIGDQFSGAHGLVEHLDLVDLDEDHEGEVHEEDEHTSFKYTVVGILPKLNTADDRTIFTTMDYAWAVHGNEEAHREITAIIVKPSTLLGVQTLKLDYDAIDNVQAVYSSKAVADVLNMVDTGSQLLMIVMFICVLLAAVSLLLALTASVQERKRDVGLLRLIGKSKMYILCSLVGEGLALTCIGLALGLALGHIVGATMSDLLFEQTGISLQAFRLASNEGLLIIGTLVIGIFASLGPAMKVYRTNPLSLFRN